MKLDSITPNSNSETGCGSILRAVKSFLDMVTLCLEKPIQDTNANVNSLSSISLTTTCSSLFRLFTKSLLEFSSSKERLRTHGQMWMPTPVCSSSISVWRRCHSTLFYSEFLVLLDVSRNWSGLVEWVFLWNVQSRTLLKDSSSLLLLLRTSKQFDLVFQSSVINCLLFRNFEKLFCYSVSKG